MSKTATERLKGNHRHHANMLPIVTRRNKHNTSTRSRERQKSTERRKTSSPSWTSLPVASKYSLWQWWLCSTAARSQPVPALAARHRHRRLSLHHRHPCRRLCPPLREARRLSMCARRPLPSEVAACRRSPRAPLPRHRLWRPCLQTRFRNARR